MTEESTGDVVRGERFSGGPARGFLSSLAGDERIFDADLAVDRAHVVMLAEQGVIDDDEAGEILGALDAVEQAGHGALPDGEDVHEAIEAAVIDSIGAVGGKMHTARSRNDEVATCIRYRLREDVLALVETALELRSALVDVAAEHTETVMPGYTHLQPAQPTTVAHYLLSYASALERDTERLFDAYERVNQSPLGAAAFAGTPFPVDRDRVATLLGFDGVIENSTDASATRDFLIETTGAAATLATTLSGLAEDLIVFSNKGLVALSDAYSSTSSIMPQKKNPDTMELVRASAGDASAGLNGLLTILKGLPRAYNRDLQRAHPKAFEAVDAVTEATEVAAGAVATAEWQEAALEAAADEGFSTATGVADLLAMAGLPFRTAHEIVALAARRAAERTSGEAASQASEQGADYEAVAAAAAEVLDDPLEEYVSPEAVEEALDPVHSVAMRDSFGGPAPDSTEAAIVRARSRLVEARNDLDAYTDAIGAANDLLEDEVTAYV
ncbi:argininosuccinate lyase [Natronomonas sp. EA1]|uniref:argininosuccinate lyase n=1 Tax=Natronomonas sp. EA1 TaxID=3421655 RepID=UPI003EBFD6E6